MRTWRHVPELQEYVRKPYRKYRSKRTKCRLGHSHASKREAYRCNELSVMEAAGEIWDLEQQPEFQLLESFKWKGQTIRGIKYVADFAFKDQEGVVIEDCKGMLTQVYRLKKKLFLRALEDRRFYKGESVRFLET